MPFDQKPIGIGNLTNLKKRTTKSDDEEGSSVELKKVPSEQETSEVAQLAVDVHETNDALIIVAPLAGVTPEDVRIEITEDVVVIDGEREAPVHGSDSDDLLVQECYFGPFSRSIVLPEAVNSKRAKAEFKKNVLVLTIPKLDNVRTRVIKVQSDK
ncbi:MAG: Hsp20/alpha crystallin family protein [Patescibacteria group bacterium]